jgi:hypothetical protein
MQSFSGFGETQMACHSIKDTKLAKSDVFQLRKAEVKALKI